MVRPPLPSEVLIRHDTDKCVGVHAGGHSYGRLYDRLLASRRWGKAVLEIGIGSGGSLRAWKEYFPEAVVMGLEIDRTRLVFEHRIFSIQMDVSDATRLQQFANEYADYFTFICDDGSHQIEHQLMALKVLKSCLCRNGVLVIEDVSSPDYRACFEREGCVVLEWDTEYRHDNRVAVYERQ